MRQGGGNRFGKDDLAGDPEADALTNNGQGPPSITGRLRSAADGAQAAADLVGAGAAGLAAVQAFRSQLPQDAAEYVRLNALPRPGPQPQPPRPSSGLPGRPGLCAGRVLQPRAPLRKVARVQLPHGAHAAVHGVSGSGGAQRHRGARLHETYGSVRDFLGQRRGL